MNSTIKIVLAVVVIALIINANAKEKYTKRRIGFGNSKECEIIPVSTNKMVKGTIMSKKISIAADHGYYGRNFYVSGMVSAKKAFINEPIIVVAMLYSGSDEKLRLDRMCYRNNDWDDYDVDGFKRSKEMAEVPKEKWFSFTLQSPEVHRRLNVGQGNKRPEVVAARVELWCGGELLDVNETIERSVLKKRGIGDDWYIKSLYKGKIL